MPFRAALSVPRGSSGVLLAGGPRVPARRVQPLLGFALQSPLTTCDYADEIKTVIMRRNAAVSTTAVAFHSSVLHSQLVDGVVQLRLNQLDPQAPPYDIPSTTQALWNALFKYFARGRDAPERLEVEPVLPAEALDSALLALGKCLPACTGRGVSSGLEGDRPSIPRCH